MGRPAYGARATCEFLQVDRRAPVASRRSALCWSVLYLFMDSFRERGWQH